MNTAVWSIISLIYGAFIGGALSAAIRDCFREIGVAKIRFSSSETQLKNEVKSIKRDYQKFAIVIVTFPIALPLLFVLMKFLGVDPWEPKEN